MEELRQNVHDEARVNPERYEHMANMTWEDKKLQVCTAIMLNQASEIDGIIEIVLQVYEQERLFENFVLPSLLWERKDNKWIFDCSSL